MHAKHFVGTARHNRITVAELVTEIAAQRGPIVALPRPDGRVHHFLRPRDRSDRIRLNAAIRRHLVGQTVLIGCVCCGELVAAEVVAA